MLPNKLKSPRRIYLSASILLIFLMALLQQSCKKLDTRNYALHSKDFAANFFKTKSTPTPEIAAVIEKLKAENERTGFVSKLPKDCGLPIWDKLILQKPANSNTDYKTKSHGPNAGANEEEENNNVIIPLTVTDTSLSSIIIVQNADGGLLINCYTTNDYLYNITHGAAVNSTIAMNSLGVFFYMENYSFGTNRFYHIPASLFPQSTDIDAEGNKTISMHDIEPTIMDNIIMCICIRYDCAIARPGCTYQECSCTEIGSDGPIGGGGGNGPAGPTGGGNGGGGGTTPPTPPNPSPCPFTGGSWYSLMPNPCNTPTSPTIPSNVQFLITALSLNTAQTNWLLANINRANEMYDYLEMDYNAARVQIEKDHLNRMMTDTDYLNFVQSHQINGNTSMMWWEDNQWVKNNFRFNIGASTPIVVDEELTWAEILLIAKYPVEALKIKSNVIPAQTETIRRFGDNGLNDKSDAFRHTYWLALNAKSVGFTIAILFSTAHEDEVPAKFQLEKTMDLHNNLVGASLSQPILTDAQLAEAAWNAVLNGLCRYLTPILTKQQDPNYSSTHGITPSTQVKPTNQ